MVRVRFALRIGRHFFATRASFWLAGGVLSGWALAKVRNEGWAAAQGCRLATTGSGVPFALV
jgi:hypothetical protein